MSFVCGQTGQLALNVVYVEMSVKNVFIFFLSCFRPHYSSFFKSNDIALLTGFSKQQFNGKREKIHDTSVLKSPSQWKTQVFDSIKWEKDKNIYWHSTHVYFGIHEFNSISVARANFEITPQNLPKIAKFHAFYFSNK